MISFFDAKAINIILGCIVVLSFFSMHFIEMTSFGSRVAGRVVNRVALGTTLQLSIFTLSRAFLIPFLPVLGYLVETEILKQDYLILAISSYLLTLVFSIVILLKMNKFQLFFQKIFINYDNSSIPKAFIKTLLNYDTNYELKAFENFSYDRVIVKKTFVSSIAYLFLISGFYIAFFLAIIYPDNRLTLTQFTASFHGVGAIIVATYIDPMLSRSIDINDDQKSWINNIYSILLGRVLSYVLIIFLLLLFLLIN